MPTRNLFIIIISALASLACYEKASHSRYAAEVATAIELIHDNYYEEVERRELFENAMDGLVSGLDEYSDYISPREYEQFQQAIEQEFVGIGIEVQGPPRSEELRVISPVYGAPAFHAGIRAGDVILEIDGVSTEGATLSEAVDRIKGPRGTYVELLVRHVDVETPESIRVRRDRIQTPSVLGDTRREGGRWNFHVEEHPDIAYVRVNTFGEHTTEELSEVLTNLRPPVRGLILDLRGNAGGLLTAAVDTCDMFLSGGEIVSTRGRRAADSFSYSATSDMVLDPLVPVVVLVDGFSASASEIVAACLKDHDRALVAGQRTWGKGTVQNVVPMEGGRSALKLTTASYWRPNGRNIHRREGDADDADWGVRPNPELEVVLEGDALRQVIDQRRRWDLLEPGQPRDESREDPQLEAAIEHLQSQPSVAGPATRA